MNNYNEKEIEQLQNDAMRNGEIVEELSARYDARKSFYGKAKVIEYNGTYYLLSYSTIVGMIEDGHFISFGKWSQTTTRHQKEFQRQYAYND